MTVTWCGGGAGADTIGGSPPIGSQGIVLAFMHHCVHVKSQSEISKFEAEGRGEGGGKVKVRARVGRVRVRVRVSV